MKNKRPGVMKYMLGLDAETTGINFDSFNPSQGHQAVSWGFLVINAKTLESIEELYIEIKWNDELKAKRAENKMFGKRAESVHGLTYEYLEKNGISEEKAVMKIAELILKYWGPDNTISTLGANTLKFDVAFLLSLLNKFGIDPKIAARHVDSHSVGFATIGSFTTNEFFETMGMKKREKHNALDDVKQTLESIRRVRLLWKSKVGVFIEDKNDG